MLLCNSCTNNVGRCSNQGPVTWNQKSENKVTAKLIVEADLCSFLLFKGCDMMMTIKYVWKQTHCQPDSELSL